MPYFQRTGMISHRHPFYGDVDPIAAAAAQAAIDAATSGLGPAEPTDVQSPTPAPPIETGPVSSGLPAWLIPAGLVAAGLVVLVTFFGREKGKKR